MSGGEGGKKEGKVGEDERKKEGSIEPALERACDLSTRLDDECEGAERAHKRQAPHQPPASVAARQSHRCRVRQSLRSHEASAAQRAAKGASTVVGSSMMLNKMPTELLEAVLSCKLCCHTPLRAHATPLCRPRAATRPRRRTANVRKG